MKKITLAFLLLGALVAKAQEVQNDTIIQSLKESIDEHSMKFSGLDERLATMDSDLAKLTKIKISGYIQAQYDMYDTWGAAGHGISVASTTPPTLITNSFFLRRARIKFAYEAADGVKFVLQPDFAFDKVSLKDAYVVLNDRWTKTFSLYMGQFDRPNYEVEYSSGSMEMLERSKMAGILYPGEKELGAKLEANLDTKFNFPLKLQLAVLNGNFNLGTTANQTKDIDSRKDIMARAVYSIKLPSSGLGIDLGAHGYFGKTVILPGTTLTGFTDVNHKAFTPKVGDLLDKSWLGVEMQVYYDLLGGMALKGEYISGTISGTTNPIQVNSSYAYNRVRDFAGFYTTLIKNIGVKNQFIARYDVWDPTTNASGNEVTNSGDLKYSTWSMSWQYFFDDNVKINLGYSIPTNEKSTNSGVGVDYLNRDKKDNTFTIRLQAKF
jgi:hypothetical protein